MGVLEAYERPKAFVRRAWTRALVGGIPVLCQGMVEDSRSIISFSASQDTFVRVGGVGHGHNQPDRPCFILPQAARFPPSSGKDGVLVDANLPLSSLAVIVMGSQG